jgi:hypothetical protein
MATLLRTIDLICIVCDKKDKYLFDIFVVFWYIFPHIGMLFQDKSGNPAWIFDPRSNQEPSAHVHTYVLRVDFETEQILDQSAKEFGETMKTFAAPDRCDQIKIKMNKGMSYTPLCA